MRRDKYSFVLHVLQGGLNWLHDTMQVYGADLLVTASLPRHLAATSSIFHARTWGIEWDCAGDPGENKNIPAVYPSLRQVLPAANQIAFLAMFST